MTTKKGTALALSWLIATTIVFPSLKGQDNKRLLEEAKLASKNRQHELATSLYQEAAKLGNAEAHYALGRNALIPQEQREVHLATAARLGHGHALYHFLEQRLLGFDVRLTDVQEVWSIYQEAFRANPRIQFPDKEELGRLLSIYLELPDFDGQDFLRLYDIRENHLKEWNGVWILAEEASRGGRFGKPNPELTLQLILRGHHLGPSLYSAVEAVYANWTSDKATPFDICTHSYRSSDGLFCEFRHYEALEKERMARMERVRKQHCKKLKKRDCNRLWTRQKVAMKALTAYLEAKVEHEEGHNGTGAGSFMRDSLSDQKNTFVEFVEKAQKGFAPSGGQAFAEADRDLNQAYQKKLLELKNSDGPLVYDPESLRKVQRLWIPYRDAASSFLASFAPERDEISWRTWLTEKRTWEIMAVNVTGM